MSKISDQSHAKRTTATSRLVKMPAEKTLLCKDMQLGMRGVSGNYDWRTFEETLVYSNDFYYK